MGYIDESERGLIGHLQNFKKIIRTFQKEVRITGKKMLCFYADNKKRISRNAWICAIFHTIHVSQEERYYCVKTLTGQECMIRLR